MSFAWSFWDGSSYAVLGVHAPGRTLIPAIVKALETAGKSLWLVDENTSSLDGREVHPSLDGAPEDLDGALILCAPEDAAAAAKACVEAGVPKLWLDTRGKSTQAVEVARQAGIPCVVEACPLSTMPGVGWGHHAHGRIATWLGRMREVHPERAGG